MDKFSSLIFSFTLMVQLIQKYFRKVISETLIFDYPIIWELKFQRIALACGTW